MECVNHEAATVAAKPRSRMWLRGRQNQKREVRTANSELQSDNCEARTVTAETVESELQS